MKKQPKEAKPDIADLILKVQQQLTFLDKKVDTLISQSSQRPSVPSHQYQIGGRQENNFRERTFHKAICADCKKECEIPFRPTGDRPVYCKNCFAQRKSVSTFKERHDTRPREENFPHERRFEKHHDGETRKPALKKRPSYRKQKK